MCIFNKKYSKLTFSNGPQTDEEKGLWQICMHHWTVHAKVEFQKCPWDVSLAGVHSTTLDPELRNERFTLISFMGFPAILSALQPFQICIFNRKYSKLTFSNGPQLMRKRFMANLHASLDSTCKSRISKISTRCYTRGLIPIPKNLILNWEMQYLIWHFFSCEIYSWCIFLICILYLHKMHKYKFFLPVLVPRIRLNYSKNWCPCKLSKTANRNDIPQYSYPQCTAM